MSDIKQKICRLFTDHLHSVNETYLEHFYFAAWSAVKLMLAGMALLIHAILPFLFQTTASQTMGGILEAIGKRKVNIQTMRNE